MNPWTKIISEPATDALLSGDYDHPLDRLRSRMRARWCRSQLIMAGSWSWISEHREMFVYKASYNRRKKIKQSIQSSSNYLQFQLILKGPGTFLTSNQICTSLLINQHEVLHRSHPLCRSTRHRYSCWETPNPSSMLWRDINPSMLCHWCPGPCWPWLCQPSIDTKLRSQLHCHMCSYRTACTMLSPPNSRARSCLHITSLISTNIVIAKSVSERYIEISRNGTTGLDLGTRPLYSGLASVLTMNVL